MGYINIRSLFKHLEDIHLILKHSKLDLSMLGETFLNLSVGNPVLEYPGYQFVRFDRDRGSNRRGVVDWRFMLTLNMNSNILLSGMCVMVIWRLCGLN